MNGLKNFIFDIQRFAIITNTKRNTLVSGTGDDDYIDNLGGVYGGDYVTINGGFGNDHISNIGGNNLSISGGAGDDYIFSGGDNVTMNGGSGDDRICNSTLSHGNNALFEYNSGDGNDTIVGFNETSTLQIGFNNYSTIDSYGNYSTIDGYGNYSTIDSYGNYSTVGGYGNYSTIGGYGICSTQKSGDDVIVSVGDGKIFLQGAASLNSVNIAGALVAQITSDVLTYNGHSYYIFSNVVDTWEEAKAYCEALGGHLAVISNAAENFVLYNYTMRMGYGAAFFGLSDANDEGNWTWVNGEPVTYTNWEKSIDNEPNGGTRENYAMFKSMYTSGTWNDAGFDEGKTFICEWDTDDISNIIFLTEGNDYIGNTLDGAKILALGGDDFIHNNGSYTLIDGGAGNDFISLAASARGNLIQYHAGDGYDTIVGFNSTSTLKIGDYDNYFTLGGYGNYSTIGGSYSTQISGNDVIVSVGDGKITLVDAMNLSNVNIAGVKSGVTVQNGNAGNLVSGTSENDSIFNYGSNSTIEVQGGNDTVLNATGGFNSYIYGGDGNDSVLNASSSDTIYGGAGSDTIKSGDYSRVYGDEGNDFIYVASGDEGRNTISGGAGDDSISLGGSKGSNGYYSDKYGGDHNLIVYNAGDGNDIIYNYTNTDTLQIGGGYGTYSTQQSGSNIIVTVGNGKITLVGAAGLSNVNISGNFVNPLLFTGTSGADNINTYGYDFATVNALGGNDDIVNMGGKNVSINAGDGDDSVYCGVTFEENGSSRIPDNATIEGGKGNDYISTEGANNLYKYSEGDGFDTIANYFNGTLQIGGGTGTYSTQQSGNDMLVTVGDGSILILGAANMSTANIQGTYVNPLNIVGTEYTDNITNTLSGATIQALGGNDYIYSRSGENVLIDAGSGNDTIYNWSNYTTIALGTGNDSIQNYGENVFIDGGAGSDYINNYMQYVTINGGADNDYIVASSYNSISGGNGNDTIYLSTSSASGGAGDDYIKIENMQDNLIQYTSGDGNDLIQGFNETSTLQIGGGSGTYSTTKSGSDIIVTVGEGLITLAGAANFSAVNINGLDKTETALNISNTVNNILINGTVYNDMISNTGENVTIQALNGDDSVQNNADNASINGSEGNDTIINRGNLTTILGGAGDDYVKMSDEGGKGGVYVYTGGNDTVNVDYWCLHTIVLGDVSVESSVGTNGDAYGILNLSNGKTLEIRPFDTLSWHVRVVSSMDEVPRVSNVIDSGDSFVSLTGANQTGTIDLIHNGGDKVTINGDKSDYWILNTGTYGKITTSTGNDTVFNRGGNKSTISTGAGDDDISNAASNVSINSGTGDDFIENRDGNSNITVDAGDGNDYIYNEWGENNSLLGGAGNDTFNAGKNSTIYAGSGNDRVDHPNYGGKVFLEDGDDLFIAYGQTVHDDGTTLRSEDYFVDGGAGEDNFIINGGTGATINGGTGDDFIRNNDSTNLLITYTSGDGNDYVQGFNETSTLQIGGGTGTYSMSTSGSDIIVTVGEGSITLQGAANLSAVNINGEEIFTEPVWTLDGTTATYGTTKETLITVTGVKSLDGISLSGTTVTIAKASVNASKVTISNGYNLALADDVSKPDTTNAWALSGTTATYNQTTSAGYTLTNNEIIYSKKSVTSLATVEGVTSKDGLSIDEENKIVTVSTNSLGTSKVTISNGYNLALADDVTKPDTTNAWTFSGTTATYNQTTSAGYTLTNNEIIYSKKSTTPLATVEGVTSKDGLSLSGKVVTVSKTSLGTNEVTISDGYTLALADDVETSSTIPADWSLEGTTATYFSESTNEGYTLADNAITYSEGTTAAALVTVKGVKASTGLSLNGTVVTVAKASLTNKNITVSDGYTLKLAKNVAAPSTLEADWTLDGTTATYFSESKTKGYTLASDSKSIKYSKAVAEKSLAQIDGVTSTDGLTISGNTIKATASGLAKNISVSSDSYVFDFASDYKKVTISGGEDDETIKAAGQRVILSGGAGDDSIFGSGKYTSINAGIGDNFVELGAKASNSTVRSDGGNDTVSNKASNALIDTKGGKDLIVNEGASTTIDSGAGNDSIANSGADVSISAGDGNDTILSSGANVSISGGKGNDFISSGGINMAYIPGTNGNDKGDDRVISSGRADYLFGDAGDDVLDANGGNDSLEGGTGNDTLIGGSGADTFIYANGDGNDVITDYEEEDTIKITSGTISRITTNSAGNVIFKIGSGQITVQDAADKLIAYEDANGVKRLYPVEFNSTYTGATLRSEYGKDEFISSNYTDYGTLKTVDASAVEHDMTIEGNKEANRITGSTQDDFINGYSGADVLYGGAGADTLAGSGGNDKLFGQAGNDSLSGGSGDDTLEGGAGNDYLTGGAGADLFVFNEGNGRNVITDYNEAQGDKVSINAAASSIKYEVGKSNVLITFGTADRITLKNSADQTVTYLDEDGVEHVIGNKTVEYNAAGTSATLTEYYDKDAFTPNDYSDYASTLKTIDASAVTHTLAIGGDSLANYITGSDQDDTIDGAAGADKLYGGDGNDSLRGGAGNDSLYGEDGNDTLEGGQGADILTGGAGADLFVFNTGDGRNVIADYSEEQGDKISINADASSIKYEVGKSNILITFGTSDRVTLKNSAEQAVTYVDANGVETVINNKKVVYNTAGTSATLTEYYEDDAFTPNDYSDHASTLKTIDASAVTHDLTIEGNKEANRITGSTQDDFINGYSGADVLYGGAGADTLAGSGGNDKLFGQAGNDSLSGGSGDDTLEGGAGNDYLTGGAGADLFVFNEGNGRNVITDYNGEQGDKISISADASSIYYETGKSNLLLTFGKSDRITLKNSAEQAVTIVDVNGIEYSINNKSVLYNAAGTSATLTSFYEDDAFPSTEYSDYATTLKTIDASAVEHDLTIEGNKQANRITGSAQDDFINGFGGADTIYGGAGADTLAGSGGNDKLFGEAGNDSLSGGSGEDTLEGGVGNDYLTGGAGADLFVFNKGNGRNVITDYNEAQGDKISINAAASSVKFEVGKSNILITFGTSDRVTLKNSAEQAVTWIDEDGVEHGNNNKTVLYNDAGTGATLTGFYDKDAFTPDNYSDYATTLKTIDASAVTHTLAIEGNKLANYITGSDQNDTIDGASGADIIYGGDGNDSLVGSAGNDYLSGGDGHNILWGGAGNDTLVGGEGYNTFIYNDGDGKDVIEGYRDGYDTIILNSGKIEALYEDGNDVVFEIGTGSITVKDAKSQVVALYDSSSNMYRPYHRANAN